MSAASTVAPPAAPPPPNESGKNALNAALDWTKVSTGIAAGALVYGVGLLNNATTFNNAVRTLLMLAWVSLGLAVLAGIVAQSAIPPMLAENNYSLEAPAYTWPARIHQLAWLAGVILLGLALYRILFAPPAVSALKISNAQQALSSAVNSVPPGRSIQKTTVIELIKGADPSDRSSARWHVQFLLAPSSEGPSMQSGGGALDVIVDPVSGRATPIAQNR